jgi:hypothetical protein
MEATADAVAGSSVREVSFLCLVEGSFPPSCSEDVFRAGAGAHASATATPASAATNPVASTSSKRFAFSKTRRAAVTPSAEASHVPSASSAFVGVIGASAETALF